MSKLTIILLLLLVAVASPLASIAETAPAQSESQLLDQYYLYLFGGQGTAPEPDRAMALLTQAADQGHPRAQALLGMCYRFGRFVKPDAALARQWLERSARAGNGVAQYHLGLLLTERADGVEDLQQTYIWWTVAADQGDLLAKEALKELDYRLSEEDKTAARQRYADLFALTAAKDTVATAVPTQPEAPRPEGSLGSIDLRDVKAQWVFNRAAGNLFVLQGNAYNGYPAARSQLRVLAALRGAQGQVLAEQAVYCGNFLSVSQLSEMTAREIQQQQQQPHATGQVIAPGQASPFIIVFHDVPPHVVQYTLTGDSQPAVRE